MRGITTLLWIGLSGLFALSNASARPLAAQTGTETDWPVLSADGRILAYLESTNESSPAPVIQVNDRLTGETRTLPITQDSERPDGWSFELAISADGRFLAFASLASNLVKGDSNGQADIFIADRLNGTIELISRAYGGGPSDGWSAGPSLSADGRFVAFSSSASNLVLDDSNQAVDVFIHDQLTGQTRRVSVASNGSQSSQGAGWVTAISADGRLIAFTSRAIDLTPGSPVKGKAIYLHNRVTRETRRVSQPPESHQTAPVWLADWPSLSSNGRYLAHTFVLEDPQSEPTASEVLVVVSDLVRGELVFQQAFRFPGANPYSGVIRASLSGDGSRLAVTGPAGNSAAPTTGSLRLYDLPSGEPLPLTPSGPAQAFQGRAAWMAQDGGTVAFLGASPNPETGLSEAIQVISLDDDRAMGLTLSGQVTDGLGAPLASVRISLGERYRATTDRQGYFYLTGIQPGTHRLLLDKEGYRFEPGTESITMAQDLAGQQVTAWPDSLLEEARLDIGMPYSFYRGCDSPYIGCGGPYHGFQAGYCTDLVLDAYRWGLDFHIQYALDRDARAHPGHFYRWGNARNSHDMWRYFSYTGQVLPHAEAYLPGDIVFFDWDQDAVMDHVALVDAVDEGGRPISLLDATGVIDSNPTGLAAELPWERYHEDSVWGHARWQGSYGAVLDATPGDLQVLQVALDSPHIEVRLVDEQGRELAARGAPASADPIPGGLTYDLRSGVVLSVLSPYPAARAFMVELTARQDSDYYLHLKAQQGGWTTTYQPPRKRHLDAGQVRRIGLLLEEVNGELSFQTLELDGTPSRP